MAHPIEVKANAIAQLLLGSSVKTVSANLEVPKQTVSRWKDEGRAIMADYWRNHPEAKWLMVLAANLRKSGTKKRLQDAKPAPR